jgi:hypothetical protein
MAYYLKAVDALDSDEANAVVAKMRKMPIHDFFADRELCPRRWAYGTRHVLGRG